MEDLYDSWISQAAGVRDLQMKLGSAAMDPRGNWGHAAKIMAFGGQGRHLQR